MANDWSGRNVVILGLARQGVALARYFARQGAHITVSDVAPADQLQREIAQLGDLPVARVLGEHPLSLLENCDLLCLSGGVPANLPIVQAAVSQGIALSNDSLLTLQEVRRLALGPVVAITGSSGKTTTATLVGKMLEASGLTVHVGGNIGVPLIDRLDTIAPGDRIVLELSSFQLELFDPRRAWGPVAAVGPAVAAILNITPNHLDRHADMAAYADAKFNLLRCLPQGATVVLSAEDPVTRRVANGGRQGNDPPLPSAWALDALLEEIGALVTGRHGPVALFHRCQRVVPGAWGDGGQWLSYGDAPICRREELKLRGEHNVSNMLAAVAISAAVGATVPGMAEVARSFAGVPHRLEVVSDAGRVQWINDSIATSPERAMAGLRCFAEKQALILLAGGKDKNLAWEEFADEVLARVDYLIGFGQAGAMVVRKVQEQAEFRRCTAPSTAVVNRLEEAVDLAARAAAPDTVVLLSPGGTSYDAYRNFEERGEHFRRLVRERERLSDVESAALRITEETS